MKRMAFVMALVVSLGAALTTATWAADDSKVNAATNQVKSGAKEIGDGKIGTGVEDTAKGIGNTVVEGAKYTGEKLKESGRSAEPQAKSAGRSFKDGFDAFGTSVKNFFTRLFGR
ncbi:MAG: hypothetical protein DMD91_16045 [Candidatus Rokuibacteriota bacterium]|nr:MAG: hypothetical protein DMD91_16045 [Candidatus Rokubacteria bacterium]